MSVRYTHAAEETVRGALRFIFTPAPISFAGTCGKLSGSVTS